MNFLKQKKKLILSVCIMALVFGATFFVFRIMASAPTNIKTEYKNAWSENAGWFNFGSSDGGVMVTDSALEGYVWSENMGWISLNCSNDNSCSTVDYKVANDGEGNLSGYAWGENVGWINFSPTDGGVNINLAGEFSGYAWGENVGWIIFNCQDVDSCSTSDFKVSTTWLPISAREQSEDENREGVEISDVHYSSTDTTIVINWKTNHDADSRVRWGKDKNLEEEENSKKEEEKHRVTLRDLEPNTKYFFRIKSTDEDDSSDSSKIYSIATQPSSSSFANRQWGSFEDGSESRENFEEVKIDVSDKREEDVSRESSEAEISEISKPFAIADSFSFLAQKISKTATAFWGGVKFGVNGVYGIILNGQRNIVGLFDWTGERLAGAYSLMVSMFNQEKATEIARFNQAKFFTTEVFSRNEKKLLAEVRFQIIDRNDNPIPNLDTMLFSDPQSSITDENGITTFKDVPMGSHTLAFDWEGENFKKEVVIADTLTDEGKVRAEIVQVKAEKEKLAIWMWMMIVLLVLATVATGYFARKYYQLKKILTQH